MADKRSEAERDLFEAHRLAGLAQTAHLIAAVFNSAGKSCERTINPKEIFDQLCGEESEPQEDDEREEGSLAVLYAERRTREEAAMETRDVN